jgi:transposase
MVKKQEKAKFLNDKINRTFSEELKKAKIKEVEKGGLKISVLCKELGISRTTAYKWLYLYSSLEKGVKMVVQMESEAQKTLYLQSRIAELERIVGQKQMEIDYLHKAFELGSLELGYDLKKKYAPQPWNGLDSRTAPTK